MAITAVIIDSREPDWAQQLNFNVPTIVQQLPAGDFMLATEDNAMLLVERKTSDDFLNSIRDGRLFEQISNMLEETRHVYVLITGTLQPDPAGGVITDHGATGWKWASVQGTMLTMQELGAFIILCPDVKELVPTIKRLGDRDRKDEYLLPVKWPKAMSPQEVVLAALPGIGVERTARALDAVGSAAWALVCLTDQISEIPGIPQAIKPRIRAALGLKENEQFFIGTLDEP